jgi:4a-hydroxytetrahydrobiopterin dehydratase
MPKLLTDEEIEERMARLEGWKREQTFITKVFEFKNFKKAMKFANRVAEIAEGQNHHPDIRISYNQVTLSIQTHSEGGLTKWDFDLAKAIDKID